MYRIRRAKAEDATTLLKLARTVHFINLPPDRDIIASKIAVSRQAFQRAASGTERREDLRLPKKPNEQVRGFGQGIEDSDQFMFILEDTETGSVLGSSQLIARMGGPGNPNYSFKLQRRHFFAEDIKTGTSHIVATLHSDESGPTEIGGLILQPTSRGANLGRFLSFIRFHYIAQRRELFADRLLAEMMAPITEDGSSLFWEYVGRRFIPLSYTEADTQCGRSREFIASLLPHEDIYLSLLPPAARDVVGMVHKETMPARRILEKLGFKFNELVDPFDAGPQLEAPTDEVAIVKMSKTVQLADPVPVEVADRQGMVSMLHKDGEFFAVWGPMKHAADGTVAITEEAMRALAVKAGDEVGITDMTEGIPDARKAPAAQAVTQATTQAKNQTETV